MNEQEGEGIQQLGEGELGEQDQLGQRDQQLGERDQQFGEQDQLGQRDQQLGQQDQLGRDQQLGQPGQRDQQLGQRDQQLGQRDQQLGQQQMGEQRPGMQPGAKDIQQPMQQPQQQTASGTVQKVDFAKGELTLDSAQGQLTLHARPFDLGQVVQGDQIQVQYAEYGQEKWVAVSGQADQNLRNYGGSTQLTGVIEQIDQQKGELTVKGQKIKVHPSQLQNFQQGQVVQLEYVTIDGQPWASNVQMGQGEAQQGT